MGRTRRGGADFYSKQARASGFPARSVWKLEELDRRHRLLRGGMHVLDLGAAPGSWTLYARDRVGDAGSVTAVDLGPRPAALGAPARACAGCRRMSPGRRCAASCAGSGFT